MLNIFVRYLLSKEYLIPVFFLSLIVSDTIFKNADKLPIIIYGLIGITIFFINKNKRVDYSLFALLLFSVYLFLIAGLNNFDFSSIQYPVLFLLYVGLVYYLGVRTKKNPNYINRIISNFAGAHLLFILYGLFELIIYFFFNITLITHDYDGVFYKIDSFYDNPNHFGIISALVFVMYASGSISGKKLRYVGSLLAISGVIISGSSNALMLPIIFFIFILFGMARSFLILFLMAIFIGMAIPFYEGLIEIFDIVLNKRVDIWSKGIIMFSESPVFGIGLGNYQLLNNTMDFYTNVDENYGLHSLYL